MGAATGVAWRLCLLLVAFLVLFQCRVAGAAVAQEGEDECSGDCAALAGLYNTTGGLLWVHSAGWMSGQPCETAETGSSSWYGVECTAGRVTGLSLAHNNLAGPLPASLASVTSLTSIDFGSNALTGSLPEEWSSLFLLDTLYLNSNQLEGTIPSSFGSLASLSHLKLSKNLLFGTIPVELGQLSSLRRLYLGTNQLQGTVPEALFSLPYMEELSLHDNLLFGSIGPFDVHGRLAVLDLGNNELDGTVPTALGHMDTVMTLSLSNNSFTGALPVFSNTSQLHTYKIASNEFVGPLAFLARLKLIAEIDVSHNQFDCAMPQFASSHSPMLSAIDLSYTGIHGTVPQSLGGLHLTSLLLRNNSLDGQLPDFLQHEAMFEVDLRDNSFACPLPLWCGEDGNGMCAPCDGFWFSGSSQDSESSGSVVVEEETTGENNDGGGGGSGNDVDEVLLLGGIVGVTILIVLVAVLLFAVFVVYRRVRYPAFIPVANMDIGDDDL